MGLLIAIFAALAIFVLASFFALYSYGRFAAQAQGAPSASLPVADDETLLDALVAPLVAEHPQQSGLALVVDNLHAFAVRSVTARRAGRSLDLQYYIWKNDLTGSLLVDEIIKAADRGVRVRMLLDDMNVQGYDRTFLALDAHPNIEVRLFNPSRTRTGAIRRGIELLLRAMAITRRMHNKAWIADGRVAIVGGRNIGDAYFDAAEISNFRDLDLLLLGVAVQQAEHVFDDFWNSTSVIPIRALGTPRPTDLPKARKELVDILTHETAGPYLNRIAEEKNLRTTQADDGHIYWTAQARIVSDPPEKVKGTGQENWLVNAVRPLLGSATGDLEIVSPYFIPGDAGTNQLVAMAERGVRISILTNSLAATDVTAVHGAYAPYREPLIKGGINLFELKPYGIRSKISLFGSSSASLHTKAFTVDSRSGFIGSMNFDPRSISLNAEMGVIFDHPDLVEEVRQIFADETSPQKSYSVRLNDGKLVWQDVAAGAARTSHGEPGAGFWRRLTAAAIGLLPIQSQL